MRVLQSHETRIRLGWLRPLARLARAGAKGPKLLGEALLRDYEAAHHAWTAPGSRFARALTRRSSEDIARSANLYGLELPEDRDLVPPIRAALLALDPWPDGGSDDPFVWDDGLAFVGLTALFSANGDVLVPLLSCWEDGAEPLPLLASVVETLLSTQGGERAQGLVTARRFLDARQANPSDAWKHVGRPWLEPLVELGLLRADAALQYVLTPRGVALAARWREAPMSTDQRLRETLAEDWVSALGQTPREPTDEELFAALSACPNFSEHGRRLARLEELALWAQATWIRTAPGVCASAPTLLRLIGRVGFAERAGVELGSGLMSYETFLRWTGPTQAPSTEDAPHEDELDEGHAASSLSALDSPAVTPDEAGKTDVADATERSIEPLPDGHVAAANLAPPLPVGGDGAPAAPPERHFLAWRSYALSLLETKGALAMGGPRLWLRQLGELIGDPAAAHLVQAWRKEELWPRDDETWGVQATLLAGLVELRHVPIARKLPAARTFLDLLKRWQDTQADLARVRALLHECERGLDALNAALLGELGEWLAEPTRRSTAERWPDIRRITRWILADAALLGGHRREELRGELRRLEPASFEDLARHLTRRPARRWQATQTFLLLGEGLTRAHLDRARDEVVQGLASRASGAPVMTLDAAQRPARDEPDSNTPAAPLNWRLIIEASIEASSDDHARQEASLLFAQIRARTRHLLAIYGAVWPQVQPGGDPGEALEVVLETQEAPIQRSQDHERRRESSGRAAPNSVELGFVAAPHPVDPGAYAHFDDALLSLARASESEGGEAEAAQLTWIWVALERLQLAMERGRAGEVLLSASLLMARLAFAAEAGELLRKAAAALHEAALVGAPQSEGALNLWQQLYGDEEAQRYREAGTVLLRPRDQLFGTPLAVNDEEALVRLANLSSRAPRDSSGRSDPLGELANLVEPRDPQLAMDLRAFGRDLHSEKSLLSRLRAERLLIAGALHRAYRVRNRMVHASDTGLGEDRELFAELRRHLIPKVDRLIAALSHPRCEGLGLAERWALVQERLDRVKLRDDERPKDERGKNKNRPNDAGDEGTELGAPQRGGASSTPAENAKQNEPKVTLPDLLARSAWGTSD